MLIRESLCRLRQYARELVCDPLLWSEVYEAILLDPGRLFLLVGTGHLKKWQAVPDESFIELVLVDSG